MAKDWKSWIERDKLAEQIINAAAKVSGIPVKSLVGFDRRRRIFRVRALTMLIIREDAGVTWSDIARKFAGRNHTSVIYAVEQARNIELLETYQKILSEIRLEVAILSGKQRFALRHLQWALQSLSGLGNRVRRSRSLDCSAIRLADQKPFVVHRHHGWFAPHALSLSDRKTDTRWTMQH